MYFILLIGNETDDIFIKLYLMGKLNKMHSKDQGLTPTHLSQFPAVPSTGTPLILTWTIIKVFFV